MAAVLQALHLTPGRRLLACLEKLHSVPQIPSKTATMHPFVTHLLHFLKEEGQGTKILQDIAAAVGCAQDDRMITSKVDQLMLHLVHAMMSCSDYKVRDMGHRHELKFVVEKQVYGCPHRPSDEIIKQTDYSVTLKLNDFRGGNLSAVQNALDNSLKTTCKHTCGQCNQDNVLKYNIAIRLKRFIRPFCDPDFLTILFDEPKNLLEKDLILQLGESTYAVKAVTHWDEERQKSAASVQRSDGWWWHGTDMEQASHYRYSEKQVSSGTPFSKAIVLMCVRVVPYTDYLRNSENMEDLMDIEKSHKEMESDDKDMDSVEVGDVDDILGDYGKDEQDQRRNDWIDGENQTNKQSRSDGLREGCSDPNLLYDYEAALVESRRTNPNLKTQAEMVDIGIQCMGSFGVACSRPEDYTPLDGDCLWTCFVKSRYPSLVGDALRAEKFHYRLRCVGAAIEEIKSMDAERLAMVQSVIADAKVGVPPQSREEIIAHLRRYMERGIWDGQMGDLLPYVAASFLNQGLLIVNLDSRTITYAAPECKMFHGREDFKVPCIAVRQLNHFQGVPIKHDYNEVASALYEMIKNGEHLTLPADVGDINDGQFEPEQTSTPLAGGTTPSEQNKVGQSEEGASRSLFEEQHEHAESSLASTAGAEMETQRSQVGHITYH